VMPFPALQAHYKQYQTTQISIQSPPAPPAPSKSPIPLPIPSSLNHYFSGLLSCLQTQPNFVNPVQEFGVGGTIGFEPIDVNGNYLTQCTTVTDANPIVTDTSTCSSTPGGKSTIVYTHTQTVTVAGRGY
jgi:hypothetical protein